MAARLDDISVAIGELKAGQAESQRIANNLNAKIDKIVESLDRLPPSPICIEKHKEIDALKLNHAKILMGTAFLGSTIGVAATWVAKFFGYPPSH